MPKEKDYDLLLDHILREASYMNIVSEPHLGEYYNHNFQKHGFTYSEFTEGIIKLRNEGYITTHEDGQRGKLTLNGYIMRSKGGFKAKARREWRKDKATLGNILLLLLFGAIAAGQTLYQIFGDTEDKGQKGIVIQNIQQVQPSSIDTSHSITIAADTTKKDSLPK